MPVVAVHDISKIYGAKKVLDKVSFTIEQGEVFGLLGSNGAGKSTITSIILGLTKPTSGSVTLFGNANIQSQKKKIALVPQEPAFYLDFSIEKNMHFFASIAGLKGKQKKDRIEFLLKWLELAPYRGVKSEFLSGGYQRLLNIAISLLHDPQLIFMDEPTVGLDPRMRELFWNKIFELKKNGKTIILTTHYMDEAQELCSRVVLLKNGSLIATGKPLELIRKYGGIKVVTFQLASALSQVDSEMIRMMAQTKGIVLKDNFIILPFEQESSIERVAGITEYLMKKGYTITSSVTKEPNLEDVFMNIVEGKDK